MFGLDYIIGRLESTLVGQKILTFGDLMYVMYIAITYMFRRKVVCDRKNRTDQAYVEQNRSGICVRATSIFKATKLISKNQALQILYHMYVAIESLFV